MVLETETMKKIGLIFIIMIVFISCKKEVKTQKHVNTTTSGNVFGTYYNIQLFDTVAHQYDKQYDSLFTQVNKAMSTYWKDSDITKINTGDTTVVVGKHFEKVFQISKQIYKETNGYFDPTIGVLVNAWDFGPSGRIVSLDSLKIDSLMQSVGFDKVKIINNKISKQKNTFIDFNAIAKGYGLDVISKFLENKGYQNYLIDIGGEIVAKGKNLIKNKPFRIGIEKPNFDGTQSQQLVISLSNKAMATSGVYRKFKVDENGNKYAHIINPKTGFPSKTNILSVSVIAPTCAVADAYATAFKAMGIKSVTALLKTHPELQVYFIYEDDAQKMQTLSLNNFPK